VETARERIQSRLLLRQILWCSHYFDHTNENSDDDEDYKQDDGSSSDENLDDDDDYKLFV
jgi:hypothetical protein